MKKKVVKQPKEICIERAKLITESYKKTKGENPIIRFAKAMEHYLSNMTIKIWDDEFIVGNRTIKFVGTPLFPEIRIGTIEQDIDTYENRPVQALLLSNEDRTMVKEEIIPYWKNEEETVQARFQSYLNSDQKNILDKLVFYAEVELINGIGHFFVGHENVLKFGINGLIQKAQEKIKDFSRSDLEERKKRIFLESVVIVCNSVKKVIQRFSILAYKIAENETNPARQKELFEISEICNNISENPPNSFKEAIQLIYFSHLISGLEDGGFGISIGRLDQYLYPYYLLDKNEGKISDEEVQFLIECFFIKLSTLWNQIFYLGIYGGEGPPISENSTIAGIDRLGNDATNELSYIILDAYTHIKTVQPTFSVRIHKKTPEDFLIKVCESIKTGTSIALFNDQVMIKGLQNRGFTLEDAREYAPIGCVEPQHPYKSFGSTNASQLNLIKILELTLTNGTDMSTRRDYGLKSNKKIDSYEDLWEAFTNQLNYFIRYMVSTMNTLDRAIAELNPQPFLSATTENCLERGLDVTNGGAVYNFTGPQAIGLATVSDSLAVIKKLVFDEKILPYEDLVEMLKKNYRSIYQGRKGEEWRQIFINKVPKFGNDNDYVDQIAVAVAKAYCDEIVKYNNYRGGKFNPGIYSTSYHLVFGALTGASANGRKARDALSNGVGPSNGMDKNGPTAILNSVGKLKNELMTNGNSLILAFHPNTLKIEVFPALIRAFFKPDGGFQIQFNVVGKEILLNAQNNPEEYLGLVIRIAGYSVLFTELSKNAQDDIIARTECSME